MKELSIEEKAQRYDEAIKKFDVILNLNTVKESGTIFVDDVRKIFPELAESEDERIRKELIAMVKLSCTNGEDVDKKIAWLEKQGEKLNNVYDEELSEILGRVIRRYINDPNIPYTEREKVSIEIIPYVERLEKQGDQKPAWSKEDDYNLQCMIAKVTSDIQKGNVGRNNELISWLKSLKDRYTWKPSDEQIKALNYVVNLMASSERPTENDLYYNILKSLRQQLKKLREE